MNAIRGPSVPLIGRRRRGWRQILRRAVVAVEMAVVTPLLLTVLFGIIEYGWVFTVRQALVTAARDGARTAALPGNNVELQEQRTRTRIEGVLATVGLTANEYDVDLTHPQAGDSPKVETVRISVPYRKVTLVGAYFGCADSDIVVTCSMSKEGVE